jgi:hypothetical protein
MGERKKKTILDQKENVVFGNPFFSVQALSIY